MVYNVVTSIGENQTATFELFFESPLFFFESPQPSMAVAIWRGATYRPTEKYGLRRIFQRRESRARARTFQTGEGRGLLSEKEANLLLRGGERNIFLRCARQPEFPVRARTSQSPYLSVGW